MKIFRYTDDYFDIYMIRMISIFLQHSQESPFSRANPIKLIFIFTLLLFLGFSKNYTVFTSSTQCEITMVNMEELTELNANLKPVIKKCIQKYCTSFKPTGDCKVEQKIVLEDEQNCLLKCCGSTVYEKQQCIAYNQEMQEKKEASNRILIIVLASSITGVVIAVIFFAVCFMKCFKNNEEELQQEIRAKNGGNCNQNFQMFWRPYKFANDKTCQICKKGDAFVMLQCQQFFHQKCLNQILEWRCPHCNIQICKARVFCLTCSKSYITLKVNSFEELEYKIGCGYQFHPQRCFEQVISQIETDRKMTVSTRE